MVEVAVHGGGDRQVQTAGPGGMALPSSLYQSLITKLVVVLDLVQQSEGITTPQAKQALLHAVSRPTELYCPVFFADGIIRPTIFAMP